MYRAIYGPDSFNTKLFLAVNHLHHPLLDPLMQALAYLGSSKMIYLYAAVLAVFALVRPKDVPWQYPLLYLGTTLAALVVEEGLKDFFHVPRPALALGLEKVRVLGELKLKNSFPSGHAVFAGVTAVALGWRRGSRWKIPLGIFAVLVCWSRVYVGAHYPVDVAGGVAVGALTASMIWLGWEALPVGRRKKKG